MMIIIIVVILWSFYDHNQKAATKQMQFGIKSLQGWVMPNTLHFLIYQSTDQLRRRET